MQRLEYDAYLKLIDNARLIEQDGSGPKVYLLQDNRYLKLFRRKRLISSALLFPYARRFARNLQALKKRQIPCPEIVAIWRIPEIRRDAVLYVPLEGQTIRNLLKENEDPARLSGLKAALGAFIALLHDRGIYFRSLHLGNIVLTPEKKLGLIDVADMRVKRGALGKWHRRRNIKHLTHDAGEAAWLLTGGDFSRAYETTLCK